MAEQLDSGEETNSSEIAQTYTIFGNKHDDNHKLKIRLPHTLAQSLLAMEEWKHRPRHYHDVRIFQRKPQDPAYWVELTSTRHAMEPDQVYAHVHPHKSTMKISAFGNTLKLADIQFPCTGLEVLTRLSQMPFDMTRTCLVMKPYDTDGSLVVVTPTTNLLFACDEYHLGVRNLKRKVDEEQPMDTDMPDPKRASK